MENENDEEDKLAKMKTKVDKAIGRGRWPKEGHKRGENGNKNGQNGDKKVKGKQKESLERAHHKKRKTANERVANKTTELNCQKQMEEIRKGKRKEPMNENYTKIEAPKSEKVAELVEQFVEKSNKRWAHFHGMVDELLAKEFEEKRQKLAKRKTDEGIGHNLLASVDHVYSKRRNAFILSAQTIDTVLFGVEITMSFLGVPSEILQNELNDCTRLIIRHSACKLAKAQPIFEELAKSVDTFGGILIRRIGINNSKTISLIKNIMRFLQMPSIGNPSTIQQQQQPEASDNQQQLETLHNLDIFIKFYGSMVRFCSVFHAEPNVHNEQILHDVFGTLLAFCSAIVEQFTEYSEMAKREGIERMKEAICQ
ncbi:hypothetical protein niasHT_039830 [Heterodera trifolii]|uniref:Uncharacterized protein n=1 Tax=Heterodera trifolii TaxID=157864 RepID=A0ABD2IYR5_9BILA